jgi:YD repeat-containing protein
MTASTSVHSNAFNFMSFIQNGVDPRTGQYTLAINLPALQSHDLNGPEFPISLNYNALNTLDTGYGLGWDLKLSQYTPLTKILSLSTGETFKVTEGEREPEIAEKKLDSFRFFDDGPEGYRVVHKSGLVEYLKVKGGANNRVALPDFIESAQGHRLTLLYEPFNTSQLLTSVSDGTHELLKITRTTDRVHIDQRPGAGAGAEPQPWARYTLRLESTDRRVRRIDLPAEAGASWRLDYTPVRGILCLTKVGTPTGAVETIEYRDVGHLFPNSARGRVLASDNTDLAPAVRRAAERIEQVLMKRRAPKEGEVVAEALPRVTRHIVNPGFGQPPVEVEYTYGIEGTDDQRNFLGYLARGVIWKSDGLDNLYQTTEDYRYRSTEKLMVDGSAVRTIERTFNRYHLLIEEKTTQNQCVKSVVTTYHLVPGQSFDQQPNICQLPARVETRWTDLAQSKSRSESEFSEFDEFGNPTLTVSANGVREASTWWPKTASDGCPADPYGFVRHLRERTITPANSGYTDAPVLRTRYSYDAVDPVAGGPRPWIAPTIEVTVDSRTDTEVQRSLTTYVSLPLQPMVHGRPDAVYVTMNGLMASTRYEYVKNATEQTLVTTETLKTHDNLTKVVTRVESLLTGNALIDRDDNDVVIKTTYDALDRVTAETAAPDTDEEATRYYAYKLVNEDGGQASQTVTDVKGVQTCTYFDGVNRAIREERQQADSVARASEFLQTYAARYDALGQLVEETEFDWRLGDAPELPGTEFGEGQFDWLGEAPLALATCFKYDDWGQQMVTTGPDGVADHQKADPTTLITTAWRAGMGKTLTTNNLFGKPDKEQRLRANGAIYGEHTYAYDGLGRMREEKNARGQQTAYEYDVFDRLTRNVLPDRSAVERQYASHSSEDLPTHISVNGKELGTQTFDGLSRMTQSVTGKRVRTYEYAGSLTQPKSVTTPAGAIIDYEYKPHLSDEPVSRRIRGEATDAGYVLDPLNARLLSGTESDHTLSREYFSTGELRSETRTENGQAHQMGYVYSRLGRLLSYTDVLGNTQVHTYDTAGRLIGTVLGTTVSTLTYNDRGLNDCIDTRDSAIGQQVKVSLLYDDFGRETLRTFDLGIDKLQELAQDYNNLDQMTCRTLKEAERILRDENFTYDPRGRLEIYAASGPEAPFDPAGKQIEEQYFICDDLDNHELVMTTFAGGENVAEYSYSKDDPAQLVKIVNDHEAYQGFNMSLSYDANGNLLVDEAGRELDYDALSRLVKVTPADGSVALDYGYDAVDILRSSANEQRFYCAGQLSNLVESNAGARVVRSIVRAGELLLAEHQTDASQLKTVKVKASKAKPKAPKGNSKTSKVAPE